MEQFDLFNQLSNVIPAYTKIIVLNYISIESIIKTYLTYYNTYIPECYNAYHDIPFFTQVSFKSKVNTNIYSIPSDLVRNKYGYYSNNIYDRILKFENFMNKFSDSVSNKFSFNLFTYIDIDSIIIQELSIDLRNEDESDEELDDQFSLKENIRRKKTQKTLLNTSDTMFKYAQVYNLKSIKAIIESIVEIFMLDGYSATDYTLKSFTLNSLTKTDYMVLFNYSFIVDI